MSITKQRDPKKITDVLSNGGLTNILQRARLIEAYSVALAQILPTTLLTHCRVMNIKQSILILGVDNAAWLTRLRFEEDSILNQLRMQANLPNVLGIDYKIYLEN